MSQSIAVEAPWIEESNRAFEVAFAAGNAEQLVANYYAADALLIQDGAGVHSGRLGLRAFFLQMAQQFGRCALTTTAVYALGERHVEHGSVALMPHLPELPTLHLRYVVIWKWLPDIGPRVVLDFFTGVAA